jgi:hypothetical protein
VLFLAQLTLLTRQRLVGPDRTRHRSDADRRWTAFMRRAQFFNITALRAETLYRNILRYVLASPPGFESASE